jgi:streptomycin 6-kinase
VDAALIPAAMLAHADRGEDWAVWLDELPRIAAGLLAEWDLTSDGSSMHGHCALVLPVRTAGARPAVLKIGFRDDESEHEHLALQRWHGVGAVELFRADPDRGAQLLERLHHEDLRDLEEIEACEVVAGLYQQLHVPAIPQLRTLTSYVERWSTALAALPRDAPVPRRLVEQALALCRDFVADDASTGTLIHGDLHYENVLAADRAPWLVIDPKPMSGDPHYEPAPMLWNRWEDVVAADNVRDAVRRRFHTLVDAAGLDEGRARDWVVVRMVLNLHWCLEDASRPGRGLTDEDKDWITECIAITKAVQD